MAMEGEVINLTSIDIYIREVEIEVFWLLLFTSSPGVWSIFNLIGNLEGGFSLRYIIEDICFAI